MVRSAVQFWLDSCIPVDLFLRHSTLRTEERLGSLPRRRHRARPYCSNASARSTLRPALHGCQSCCLLCQHGQRSAAFSPLLLTSGELMTCPAGAGAYSFLDGIQPLRLSHSLVCAARDYQSGAQCTGLGACAYSTVPCTASSTETGRYSCARAAKASGKRGRIIFVCIGANTSCGR